MDNGGSKPDDNMPDGDNFELEVNEKDVDFVSADIESPGEEGSDLPTDDTETVKGDIPAPEDLDDEFKGDDAPEDKPEDELETLETDQPEEKPEEEEPKDEPEEKPEESDEAEKAEEVEEPAEEEVKLETDEPKEDGPKDEGPKDEEPEDKPEEEEAKEETSEEETTNASEDEPVEEEKPEEEPTEEEKAEDEYMDGEENAEGGPAEEEKPEGEDKPEEEKSEDDKSDEIAAAAVAGAAITGAVAEEKKDEAAEKIGDEKGKKKSSPVVAIILAVVALVLVGVGIFFAISSMGKKDDKKDPSKPQEEPAELTKLDGLTEFDMNMLKNLNGEKNVIYSPMSMKYALSMLADGAGGNSKTQITDALGGEYDVKEYTNSKNISVANVLFVRDEFKDHMKQSYISMIKDKYGANTIYDPFNNASSMNDWAYENTLHLIPKILTDEEVKGIDFFLINSVAIDMYWKYLIQCESIDTKEVGCKNGGFSVEYPHEKYNQYISILTDGWREKYNFNGNDVNGLKVGAAINNYDIISDLGEDYIYNTVKDDYTQWYEERVAYAKKYQPTVSLDGVGEKPEEYMEHYMKELKSNYGRADSSTDFRLHVDDDVKLFSKDLREYDGVELQYIAIMPRKKTLKEFINNSSVDSLKELATKLKDPTSGNFKEGVVTKIEGFVPEFKYNLDIDLKKILPNMGIKDIFIQTDADLSGMTDMEGTYIELAKHSAMIDFGNEGIKAAGVTTMGGAGGAGDEYDYLWDVPVEEIDMNFDKPFMYLIRDKVTGEVWFMGTVYEPGE